MSVTISPSDQICRGKLRYHARGEAQKAARHLPKCQTYFCTGCHGFHVGRKAGAHIRRPIARRRSIIEAWALNWTPGAEA